MLLVCIEHEVADAIQHVRVHELEIRRGRTDTDPQPVLQRAGADEHGISRCEEVVPLAVTGALPFQFNCVD